MRASRVIVEDRGRSHWRPAVRNIEFDPGSLSSIFRAVTGLTGTARGILLSIELDDSESVLNVNAFLNRTWNPLPPNTVGDKWYHVTASVDDLDSDEPSVYTLIREADSPPDAPAPWIRVGGRVGRVLREELVEIQDVMDAVRWWAEYGALNPHMNWRLI